MTGRTVRLVSIGGWISEVILGSHTVDYNQSLGKEGYPTLVLEVITGNDRDILGISPVQF